MIQKQNYRILIVDDDPINLELLVDEFGERYCVVLARSGEEALKKIPEFKPALLLLDIMMPGIDGYEVCRRIRANKKLGYIRIILLSGKAAVEDRLKGYRVGANDYLVKPFDLEELEAKIKVFSQLRDVAELEKEVALRTTEIQNTNELLQLEIAERRGVEKSWLVQREKLKESKERLKEVAFQQKLILENSVVGIVFLKNNQFFDFNHRFSDMFGFDLEEVKGLSPKELYANKEEYHELSKVSRKVLSKKDYFIAERLMRHKSGKIFWCKLSGKAINADDLSQGEIWVLEDISDRKNAEQKLRMYEFMSNTSRDYMTMINARYEYVAANKAYAEAHKKKREEIIGKTIQEVWGEKVFHQVIKPRLDLCFQGKAVRYENILKFPALPTRHMEIFFLPYLENELVTHVVAITHDISQLKNAEAAQKLAKEKAEEANRMKSDFINIISHELRTPLTVILSNIPFLIDPEDLPDQEETVEIATDIRDSAKHLLVLVNDLLDFSKIEAGKLDLFRTNLSSSEVIEDVSDNITILLNDKPVAIEQEVEECVLFADKIRLKQILLNLLSNAIKFTKEGKIKILVKKEKAFARFSISDTGCGIKEEDLSIIFDVFRQVDSSLTRASEGTGLGLAITKKLTEMHGGNIEVESTVGKGTTFYFTIPLEEKQIKQG